jgi:hypothetical protein
MNSTPGTFKSSFGVKVASSCDPVGITQTFHLRIRVGAANDLPTPEQINIAQFGHENSFATHSSIQLTSPPENGKVTVKKARVTATNVKQCRGASVRFIVCARILWASMFDVGSEVSWWQDRSAAD